MVNSASATPRDVERAFAEYLAANGVAIDEDVVADGKKHRVRVEGDRRGRPSAEYILYADPPANGRFFSFRDSAVIKWRADRDSQGWQLLTPAEQEQRQKEWAAARASRRREEHHAHCEAAALAARRFETARLASAAHPYLVAKGILVPPGARQDDDARDGHPELLLPVHRLTAARKRVLIALQSISDRGEKLFYPEGCLTRGGFFSIAAMPHAPADVVLIAEGIATAMTLHEASGGCLVIAAFSCGNLPAVARTVRSTLPSARIVIAADNDHRNKGGGVRPQQRNAGIVAATAAAEAIGGHLLVPSFDDDDAGTDWNDVATNPLRGLPEVRAALHRVLLLPDSRPAGMVAIQNNMITVPSTASAADAIATTTMATAVAPPRESSAPSGRTARLKRASAVRDEETVWLWPGYLPLGALVTLDGPPGIAKTTIAIDIAARVTRGTPMPDGSGGSRPADVVLLTYEDDPARTLNPRARAAGADLDRLHYLMGVGTSDADSLPPSLPEDLAAIEAMLAENPAIRLLVIDPLMAALSSMVDSHRDQDVRRVLARLSRLAQQYHVCIVLIRHFRKQGGSALSAGGGSIGIIAQARVGLVIGYGTDAQTAVLAQAKNNLGPVAASLSFRKVSHDNPSDNGNPIVTSRLEWIGVVALSADALIGDDLTSGRGAPADEVAFLRDLLSPVTRMERREIMRIAQSQFGYSERSMDRAAERVGIIRSREGFGRDQRAYWSLPPTTCGNSACLQAAGTPSESNRGSTSVAHSGDRDQNNSSVAPSIPATSAVRKESSKLGIVAEMEDELGPIELFPLHRVS